MVVANDGWPNAIHASKEDGKKRSLDQDKIRDLKEKEGLLLGRMKCNFWLSEGAWRNR
jgi:hypothetical protein